MKGKWGGVELKTLDFIVEALDYLTRTNSFVAKLLALISTLLYKCVI